MEMITIGPVDVHRIVAALDRAGIEADMSPAARVEALVYEHEMRSEEISRLEADLAEEHGRRVAAEVRVGERLLRGGR